MRKNPPSGSQEEEGSLRVHDRFPVRLSPLNAEQSAAAAAGELHARTSGPSPSATGLEASVDSLIRAFPPDERPEGPLMEALRLVDAKLSHVLQLVEAQHEKDLTEEGTDRPVEVGLAQIRVGLPSEEGQRLGEGEWVWLDCQLPDSPRIRFEAPGRVTAVTEPGSEPEGAFWVTIRLANVTEAEEKALSEYLFRRHRQEVRQHRQPASDD